MKALLLLSVLLSGVLAITAAAVEAPEAVKVVEAPEAVKVVEVPEAVKVVEVPEAVEAAPQELQENNQNEDPEVVSGGEEAPPAEDRLSPCPAGWTRFRYACYQFVSSSKPWTYAASHCGSLGASLASVHDVTEYSFLQYLASSANLGQSVFWLGGFYFEGQWMWVDSSPFDYSHWGNQNFAPNHPCISLSATSTVGWINIPCSRNHYPFICVRKMDCC